MSEVNIDHILIDQSDTHSHTNESLVEIPNGCILLKAVEKLCKQWKYDAIIIESTLPL